MNSLRIFDKTRISGRNERLSISEGRDGYTKGPGVTLLYIPCVQDEDHEHIEMDIKECKALRDYLNEVIKNMIKLKF